MYLVDKDPSDDNGYYTDAGAQALPREEWEHRKIFGLNWQKRKGWRAETKLCADPRGPSENYIINDVLIRMIKESPRNRNVRFRSEM